MTNTLTPPPSEDSATDSAGVLEQLTTDLGGDRSGDLRVHLGQRRIGDAGTTGAHRGSSSGTDGPERSHPL